MNTYIALLRGINVSGQKIIKMDQLRKILAQLGFVDVATYIQSGNVLFRSDVENTKVLEEQIQEMIRIHFGLHVPVRITTQDDLESIIAQNPFATKTTPNSTQPYIAFLSENPREENRIKLQDVDFVDDECLIQDKMVYLWYAASAGKTKLTNAVIENKLQVIATSRNWKTVQKLLALIKN